MIRVFIYDDSNARKESLKTLFEFTDNMLCVGTASNCSDVLADMLNATPDIVLMDIEMPNTDGIEGVIQIKHQFQNIKVIMQTVYGDMDKIFKAFQYGAAGYLLKKASINDIIEYIEKVNDCQIFITPTMALQITNNFEMLANVENNPLQLSAEEWQIIKLISEGYSNKIIAVKSGVEENYINNVIKSIYKKIQV